jgi:histo-blood group ABO system transferase
MNVGILIIATASYTKFVPALEASIKKYFLVNHNVFIHYFSDKMMGFYMKHEPFPYPTLMRYHQFIKQKDVLSKMDYLFYLDADMLVVGEVGDEILGDGLTAITHPYSESRSKKNTYELNEKSTAYLEDTNLINPYCCGGFQGGTSEAYLKMSEEIASRVDKDNNNGIVARWHDETHYNKYLTEVRPSIILGRDYCTPEKEQNENSKILALDKNHKQIRE